MLQEAQEAAEQGRALDEGIPFQVRPAQNNVRAAPGADLASAHLVFESAHADRLRAGEQAANHAFIVRPVIGGRQIDLQHPGIRCQGDRFKILIVGWGIALQAQWREVERCCQVLDGPDQFRERRKARERREEHQQLALLDFNREVSTQRIAGQPTERQSQSDRAVTRDQRQVLAGGKLPLARAPLIAVMIQRQHPSGRLEECRPSFGCRFGERLRDKGPLASGKPRPPSGCVRRIGAFSDAPLHPRMPAAWFSAGPVSGQPLNELTGHPWAGGRDGFLIEAQPIRKSPQSGPPVRDR